MASKPQHTFRVPGSAVIRSFVEQDAAPAATPTLAPVPPPLPLSTVEPVAAYAPVALTPVPAEPRDEPKATAATPKREPAPEPKPEARADAATPPAPPSEPPALSALTSAEPPANEPTHEPAPASRPRQAKAVRASLPKAKGRKTVVRADGREVRKLGVYLDAALARKLALFCAEEGLDLSDVVSVAVEKFLGHGR